MDYAVVNILDYMELIGEESVVDCELPVIFPPKEKRTK